MESQIKISRKIFGVPVGNEFCDEELLDQKLIEICNAKSPRPCFIIGSLNPEILLKARENEDFRRKLSGFDANIVDGFGVQLLLWLKKKGGVKRIAGADLSERLLKLALKRKMKIGAVIRNDGWSSKEDVMKFFSNKNARCEIFEKELESSDEFFIKKNSQKLSSVEILFVFLGAPFQENFLSSMKKLITGPRIGICSGGTIDFWTSKRRRAPKIIQKFGLEWIWRLAQQPDRAGRAWKAVVVFPLKAIFCED